MASPDTESMLQTLRIYQEKLCSYYTANAELVNLKKRDVKEELEGEFEQWTAPINKIWQLANLIAAFLTITDFGLLKLQFNQIKSYLEDIKGSSYSEQMTWYSITKHGDCKLRLRLDRQTIAYPAVYTEFKYNGDAYTIEATLEALQNELNKYTFPDTHVLSSTRQDARMSVLLARLQQI
jgi:hypothetical protein